MFRKIKWAFQKIFFGYSDCDLWNLDHHLAEIILPRLKSFKKSKRHGVPGDLCPLDQTDAEFEKVIKEWEEIIDTMIKAFELIINDEWHTSKEMLEQERLIKIGLDNFAKYYRGLWD
jgi:hypothetical protein